MKCYSDEKFYVNAGDEHGRWFHVGIKTIRFWYDVNPECKSDKMLIKEEEITRKSIKPIPIKTSEIFVSENLTKKNKLIREV